MVSPDSQATACPPSGRNSTYRPVQISGTGSAVFCLGFGYMIDLLMQIRNNTMPLIEGRLERTSEVPAGYEDIYKGYPFRRLDGGKVEVLTGNGPRVFRNWTEFNAVVGG
jgi:hypothetical protein